MKTITKLLSVSIIIWSTGLVAGDYVAEQAKTEVKETLTQDLAKGIGEAYQLTGLSDIVKTKAGEKLNGLLQAKLKEFASDAFTKALNSKAKNGKVNLNKALQEVSNDPQVKAQIEADVKAKLKEWLPEVAKKVLYEDLFQGKLMQNDSIKDMMALEERIVKELDTNLNAKFDQIGQQLYGGMISDLNKYLTPPGMLARFINVDV